MSFSINLVSYLQNVFGQKLAVSSWSNFLFISLPGEDYARVRLTLLLTIHHSYVWPSDKTLTCGGKLEKLG
jgi:hypothetical protein